MNEATSYVIESTAWSGAGLIVGYSIVKIRYEVNALYRKWGRSRDERERR